jgi:hypothetical protein
MPMIRPEQPLTSPQPEPIPNADDSTIYGLRDFSFSDETWALRFTAYGDPAATFPLFTLRAEGHYSLGEPSAVVPDAREAELHFARRLFTAHAEPFVELLNGAGAGSPPWTSGVEQDVSATGALFIPSLAQARSSTTWWPSATGRSSWASARAT